MSVSDTGTGAANRLRIIALGYIVRGPLGGLAWHHLQYVMGLAELGHDVYFIEDSGDLAECYDPVKYVTSVDPSYGLRFAQQVFARVGLKDRWAYFDAHTDRWMGPAADNAPHLFQTADLVLNLSGVTVLRPWILEVPVRAFVDTDPVFTQIRHLKLADARRVAEQYTSYFSFGENIGLSECTVPDDGFPWQPTRQPIVLDAWPVTDAPPRGRFTTVMVWQSYAPAEYAGRRYSMKSKSFDAFVDLPQHVNSVLEITLGGKSAPRPLLESKGWKLRDPLKPTRTPWTYQRYIQRSKAEFSVAKHGYVVSNSGWFSERSAAYLASGRPVIAQETGFSTWLQESTGVVPFASPEEACSAIEEVNARYDAHCRAAREIVEEYFRAETVLEHLIERAMKSHIVPRPAL